MGVTSTIRTQTGGPKCVRIYKFHCTRTYIHLTSSEDSGSIPSYKLTLLPQAAKNVQNEADVRKGKLQAQVRSAKERFVQNDRKVQESELQVTCIKTTLTKLKTFKPSVALDDGVLIPPQYEMISDSESSTNVKDLSDGKEGASGAGVHGSSGRKSGLSLYTCNKERGRPMSETVERTFKSVSSLGIPKIVLEPVSDAEDATPSYPSSSINIEPISDNEVSDMQEEPNKSNEMEDSDYPLQQVVSESISAKTAVRFSPVDVEAISDAESVSGTSPMVVDIDTTNHTAPSPVGVVQPSVESVIDSQSLALKETTFGTVSPVLEGKQLNRSAQIQCEHSYCKTISTNSSIFSPTSSVPASVSLPSAPPSLPSIVSPSTASSLKYSVRATLSPVGDGLGETKGTLEIKGAHIGEKSSSSEPPKTDVRVNKDLEARSERKLNIEATEFSSESQQLPLNQTGLVQPALKSAEVDIVKEDEEMEIDCLPVIRDRTTGSDRQLVHEHTHPACTLTTAQSTPSPNSVASDPQISGHSSSLRSKEAVRSEDDLPSLPESIRQRGATATNSSSAECTLTEGMDSGKEPSSSVATSTENASVIDPTMSKVSVTAKEKAVNKPCLSASSQQEAINKPCLSASSQQEAIIKPCLSASSQNSSGSDPPVNKDSVSSTGTQEAIDECSNQPTLSRRRSLDRNKSHLDICPELKYIHRDEIFHCGTNELFTLGMNIPAEYVVPLTKVDLVFSLEVDPSCINTTALKDIQERSIRSFMTRTGTSSEETIKNAVWNKESLSLKSDVEHATVFPVPEEPHSQVAVPSMPPRPHTQATSPDTVKSRPHTQATSLDTVTSRSHTQATSPDTVKSSLGRSRKQKKPHKLTPEVKKKLLLKDDGAASLVQDSTTTDTKTVSSTEEVSKEDIEEKLQKHVEKLEHLKDQLASRIDSRADGPSQKNKRSKISDKDRKRKRAVQVLEVLSSKVKRPRRNSTSDDQTDTESMAVLGERTKTKTSEIIDLSMDITDNKEVEQAMKFLNTAFKQSLPETTPLSVEHVQQILNSAHQASCTSVQYTTSRRPLSSICISPNTMTSNTQKESKGTKVKLAPGSLLTIDSKNVPSRSSSVQSTSFLPYNSPLLTFSSYRLSPAYRNHEKLEVGSLTYSNKLDPKQILCKFETLGVCRDPKCTAQHLRDVRPSKEEIVTNLVSYAPGLAGCSQEELFTVETSQPQSQKEVASKISNFATSVVERYSSKLSDEEIFNLTTHVVNKGRKSGTNSTSTKRGYISFDDRQWLSNSSPLENEASKVKVQSQPLPAGAGLSVSGMELLSLEWDGELSMEISTSSHQDLKRYDIVIVCVCVQHVCHNNSLTGHCNGTFLS